MTQKKNLWKKTRWLRWAVPVVFTIISISLMIFLNNDKSKEIYNVESHNQLGGITAGKININQKTDSIIRSFNFRISLDFFLKEESNIKEGTSVGLANIVALFSKDKTRYRFITDYQFTISKLESGRQSLILNYKPENPDQIIGKDIDFLKDINRLVMDYQDFLNTIFGSSIDKSKPMVFNWDIYLNSVNIISLLEELPAGTICDGQAKIGLNLGNIDEIYKSKSI